MVIRRAPAAAAELVETYAPELDVVGTYAAAAITDIAAIPPAIDANFLAGTTGYILRGIIASYPETEQAIRDLLRGIRANRGTRTVV